MKPIQLEMSFIADYPSEERHDNYDKLQAGEKYPRYIIEARGSSWVMYENPDYINAAFERVHIYGKPFSCPYKK